MGILQNHFADFHKKLVSFSRYFTCANFSKAIFTKRNVAGLHCV